MRSTLFLKYVPGIKIGSSITLFDAEMSRSHDSFPGYLIPELSLTSRKCLHMLFSCRSPPSPFSQRGGCALCRLSFTARQSSQSFPFRFRSSYPLAASVNKSTRINTVHHRHRIYRHCSYIAATLLQHWDNVTAIKITIKLKEGQ